MSLTSFLFNIQKPRYFFPEVRILFLLFKKGALFRSLIRSRKARYTPPRLRPNNADNGRNGDELHFADDLMT
jgi:hypothetical protein